MQKIWIPFKALRDSIAVFHGAVYHQKHGFYFRKIRQWDECYEVRIHILKLGTKGTHLLREER